MVPEVSIIISHYQYHGYLVECLKSIEAQTYKQIECIVVDDCSDHPPRVPAWVKLIVNDENKGPAACQNIGMRAARGNFFVRMDADDMLTPDSIRVRRKMIKNRDFACGYACDVMREDKYPEIYARDPVQSR